MNFTMTWGDAALNLGLAVVAIGLWAGSARIYEWVKDVWRERSSTSASKEVVRLQQEKADFDRLLAKPEEYQRRTFLYVRDMIWLGVNTIALLLFTVVSIVMLANDRLKTPSRAEEIHLDVGFVIFFFICTYIEMGGLARKFLLMGRHLNPEKFLDYVNKKITRMKKRASRR